MFPVRSEQIWFKYPHRYQTIKDLRFIAKLEIVPIVVSFCLNVPYVFLSCLIMALVIANIADSIENKLDPRSYFRFNAPKSDNDFMDYKPIDNFNLREFDIEYLKYLYLSCKEMEYYRAKANEISCKSWRYRYKNRAEYNFYLNYIESLDNTINLHQLLYCAELKIKKSN